MSVILQLRKSEYISMIYVPYKNNMFSSFNIMNIDILYLNGWYEGFVFITNRFENLFQAHFMNDREIHMNKTAFCLNYKMYFFHQFLFLCNVWFCYEGSCFTETITHSKNFSLK